MSSQQDVQKPKAGDPSSRRFSEPDKLVLPMQGAASRSPTNKGIRTRLDVLWGKEGWISPFQHKLTGTNLLQLGY